MVPSQARTDLILLRCDALHYKTLYRWKVEEKTPQNFSCRPLKSIKGYGDWAIEFREAVEQEKVLVFILARSSAPSKPLGRFDCFDYNPRNRSIEIGYYFPGKNRGKGYGSVGIALLLDALFTEKRLRLNKVYATTSSNNLPSLALLEKTGFTKDGENREHYWIDGKRYGQAIYSMLRKEWRRRAAAKVRDQRAR